MPKPTPSQLKDYKFINTARGKLGMSDEDYRAMLKGVTGKTSLTEMDFADRFKVKERMKALGFKPIRGKKRQSPVSQGKVIDKIRAIWITLYKDGLIDDGSETALNHWVKRMTKTKYNNGLGIEAVSFLEKAKADIPVLEMLKKYENRLYAKSAADNFNLVCKPGDQVKVETETGEAITKTCSKAYVNKKGRAVIDLEMTSNGKLISYPYSLMFIKTMSSNDA